jgi:hypothetical protein
MTKWPLLISVVFLISPSLVVAQTAQTGDPSFPVQEHMPAKNAHIVSFHVSTDGTLHIIYSDGAEVEISKERGRFTDRSGEILTQEAFSDIQMADDHQHVGWLGAI